MERGERVRAQGQMEERIGHDDGPTMQRALQALGIQAEYRTASPTHACLALSGGRLLLLPLVSRRAFTDGWDLYWPGSVLGRVARRFARTAAYPVARGLVWRGLRLHGTGDTDVSVKLKQAHRLLHGKEPILAIYAGTPGPERKLVIRVPRYERTGAVYLKLAFTRTAAELVRREFDALNDLTQMSLTTAVVPQPLFAEETHHCYALATSGMERRVPMSISRRLLSFLLELAQASEQKECFGESSFYRMLRAHATVACAILPARFAKVITLATTKLGDVLGSHILPMPPSVGDFSPWNVGLDRSTGKLSIVDLEYYQRRSIPGWDLFHYGLNAGAIRIRRAGIELGSMRHLINEYLAALGIEPGIIGLLLPALLLAYQVRLLTEQLSRWASYAHVLPVERLWSAFRKVETLRELMSV